MFISLDFFGLNQGAIFQSLVCHPNYYRIEMSNGIYDQIYIDEDITVPASIEKPNDWRYKTTINAKFQNDLDAGSISAGGLVVERIRFQKRKIEDLEWEDVAEIMYEAGDKFLYEVVDKYIENDFTYQYALIPLTATVLGNRVVSNEIKADFEGIFISDKNNNYKLFYDLNFNAIEHHNASSISEPLNNQFPIVTYGTLDYRSSEITALFLSTQTAENNTVDIKMEKLGRQQLLNFLKNRKPKIMRSQNGESMLITIIENPKEEYNQNVNGIATITFSYVEIGKMDSKTLQSLGMLEGL